MLQLIIAFYMAALCPDPHCHHTVREHWQMITMNEGDDDDTGGETGTPPPKPPVPPIPPPPSGN